MNESKGIYTSQHIAFIIPTKDRPGKIKAVLESIAQQTIPCGRIIIVDGGQSVEDIVMLFSDKLPVEYYKCYPPGQIRQKNMGISLLNDQTLLVGFLDDDIVLEPQALERMITFWNGCEPDTAGVSFNIVNSPPLRHSWARALMGMSTQQGRVLRSGYNVATTPVDSHLKAQWLCGGATVWKREILKRFSGREIYSRWAICEDVIFSYPIGKAYPLYVCADAKVRHEHVYDHTAKMKYRYYGRTVTLWRLFFVESHVEFSRTFFLWMLLGQISARFVLGVFSFRMRHIEYAIGQIEGAITGLSALHRGLSLLSFLNEDTTGDGR
ncbi:MAG: glycosyltransferase family 2 protein [Planctomycetota bacterium]|jgi:glycosyltransferase involved in cell wall biosynthesis